MERQRVLYEPGREFHFVLTAAALRTRICPADVHRGQLDRLLAVGSLGNLRFGVIPDGVPVPLVPLHPFWIFDDRLVQIETWSAELNLTGRREVELYEQVFERHARAAAYGTAARQVVAEVLAELSATLPQQLPQQLPHPAEAALRSGTPEAHGAAPVRGPDSQ
jgi:hypothetical protein